MSDGTRIDFPDFKHLAPAIYAAMAALGKAVAAAGIEAALIELLKVRASQLNACSFCIVFHLDLARGAGVPQRKLDLVAGWRDTAEFSARERAALAWTEALTRIAGQPVTEADRAAVAAHFPPGELAALTTAIAHINAWNRIAGPLGFVPPAAAP
jgi:AhpD family alkylhydroperoxidase